MPHDIEGGRVLSRDDWELLIPRLRELWGSGMATSAIGRELGGLTKNAVVGKAHRLGLERRASPIKGLDGDYWVRGAPAPGGSRRSPRGERPGLVTLPPLASISGDEAGAGTFVLTQARAVAVPGKPKSLKPMTIVAPRHPKPVPVPRAVPALLARTFGRVICCLWPIGEVATPSFRFCDDPSSPGRVYCQDHCDIAYIPGSAAKVRSLVDEGERRVIRRWDRVRTAAPDWAMEFATE